MITDLTIADLVAFEAEIADLFNAAKIPHPVHLEDGNEAHLLQVFWDIKHDDWVCCGWRSHLKCLLKGVPRDTLKSAIMAGQSMALCFPEQRIVSSAIVGGILPIALGIALGIKRSGGHERVHCFLGDMTAESGIFHECAQYAGWHELPIRFLVEDNSISVCSPTREVWKIDRMKVPGVNRYRYTSKWPHAGAGKRVEF